MKGLAFVRNLCLVAALSITGLAHADESAGAMVDINSADAATLAQVLDGVGPVKAEAIIRYREANGGFMTIEELANVSGIGMATLDRNQDRITVGQE